MTPAVVADSMRNSGNAPFDPSIMMNNMWNQFKTLSTVEADEIINISQTSIRTITEQRRIVYPKECMDHLQASEILNETIEFPEVRENFEDLAWGRQLTVVLSHNYISQAVRHRAERAAQAAIVRREEDISKAEIERRDKLRFNHCSQSRRVLENQNTEHMCGGKWSNGLLGFKAHEKSNQTHALHFPDTFWQRYYEAPPVAIPAPDAVVISGGAEAAELSSELMNIIDGVEVDDPGLIYVNFQGFARYIDSSDLADLREEAQDEL